jgi:VanZ like family
MTYAQTVRQCRWLISGSVRNIMPSDEVVRKVLLHRPLGALLVPPSETKGSGFVWRPLAAGLILASLIEFCQLFVPDRTASVSDILIETTGAVLSSLLFGRLRVLLEGQPTAFSSSPARAGGLAKIPVGLGVFVVLDCA